MVSLLARARSRVTGTAWRTLQPQRRCATFTGFKDDNNDPGFFRKRGGAKTRDGIELPDGWLEHHSARGVYYAHMATGATQWDVPTGPPTQKQIQQANQERAERYRHKTSELHPGAEVRLVNLQLQPHLDGKTGICEALDMEGYVRVRLTSGELKAVKPQNLMLVAQAQTAYSETPEPPPGYPTEQTSTQDTHGTKLSRVPGWLWPILVGAGVVAYWISKYCFFLEADKKAALQREERKEAERKEKEASDKAAKAALAALPPLPPGWCQHVDTATGKPYYWKESDPTGTTTWQRPSA
eukprot:TRINITY_DN88384_c0_g1_i1.p1 TRINITY_DN88384_c0_g1~~TRINITY_DN88384_c0_g1_i1.p1  ORF type:complete len:316 (+),score=57.98 TRINITY_DN88384_c0_g1_i1:60-950(+)